MASRQFEDYVELLLVDSLENNDESEYGLFERFFHKESFVPEDADDDTDASLDEAAGVYKCRLDADIVTSETVLDDWVKSPLLRQVDEILQYLCNGFIADTPRNGDEYTEEERREIFESAIKLLYRCLFLFYAEARRLLPSEKDKTDVYQKHSIRALCKEAHKFRWGQRRNNEGHELWQRFKGLIHAVDDGDPEYGIMGYDGGLFDDKEEVFLGRHKLRNDFFSRALYLLAYVEPYDDDAEAEYEIPYEDLEVRHLGELYENILEYTVLLADADRIRRRTKNGVEIQLASETTKQKNDTLIRKGDVYFGETALERKQTGSYYTPESLVRFLNAKAIIKPLQDRFEADYRKRFDEFVEQTAGDYEAASAQSAASSAVALVERFVSEEVLQFKACDPAMGSGHFLVDAANQMAGLVVELLAEIPTGPNLRADVTSNPNDWRRLVTRHCLYGVDLNPLAVNLARLSLWLNCFATQHKLTFLDHHLRCGNSLIGLLGMEQLARIPQRRKDGKKKSTPLLEDFADLSHTLESVAEMTGSIARVDEDDTDRQKKLLDEAYDTVELSLAPAADLFTSYLMDGNIEEVDYRLLFEHFATGHGGSTLDDSHMATTWDRVKSCRGRQRFFHWAIEFPDVFGKGDSCGFDGVVGNPPWDMVKANSQEFFSDYAPEFREHTKQKAMRLAEKLMENNPAIRTKWQDYLDSLAEQTTYFREPAAYAALGKGHINTFKIFLERSFRVLSNRGSLGVVLPSGLYTDQGCGLLRELFFSESQIDFLYCFENKRGIFNIHRMFKFIIFGAARGGPTETFKCAFMEHDPDRLPAIDANALTMNVTDIAAFSPKSLSIMEFKSQRDIEITSLLYDKKAFLGEYLKSNWDAEFQREFNITDDDHLSVVFTKHVHDIAFIASVRFVRMAFSPRS